MRITINRKTYQRLLPLFDKINRTFARPHCDFDVQTLEDSTRHNKHLLIYADQAPDPDDDEVVLWIDDLLIEKIVSSYTRFISFLVPAVLGFISAVTTLSKLTETDMEEIFQLANAQFAEPEEPPAES